MTDTNILGRFLLEIENGIGAMQHEQPLNQERINRWTALAVRVREDIAHEQTEEREHREFNELQERVKEREI